ncbi:nitronate monooxygenase [Bacillus canaveralius]|uniref:Probable nitronate monooxygenase n=1 Tax=Bacillus canaveralius TaxID=1403243 RepID=A0A2N5GQX1_9BACI|nr:nitronate monooxygenase [Bacillus canaveralius]PLR85630.1 nitronate monooxygenase [Bacillus canaveralius]PLR94709.1 nitronate monooxygenase [Bacillus canaveralius]RSK50494.1 nitronate monooxygenase [Bacillus canaveralius]
MPWHHNAVTELLGITYPIFQAPMAGGITTVQLVSETSNQGGLGNLGAGYLTALQMRDDIEQIKQSTAKPFGVNLFVPAAHLDVDAHQAGAMKKLLTKYKQLLQIDGQFPELTKDYHGLFTEQVEEVLRAKVPVCSFTFGIPDQAILKEYKKTGGILIGTATNVKEAVEWEEAGADLIVAQGSEAGGHRGTFDEENKGIVGLIALVPQIVDAVQIPVIAAGGIMDGRGIAAALLLGATGVQLGTAFIACAESGAAPVYKEAVLEGSEDQTVLTKTFSGRLARGLSNTFIEEMEAAGEGPLPFPLQNELTGLIRKQAGALKNKEYMSLWAGQGVRMAKRETVASLLARLIKETNAAIELFK